jgi:hypothetical protein
MPHGSALAGAGISTIKNTLAATTISVIARTPKVVLAVFIVELQLNFDFNKTFAVISAVANPNVFQALPPVITLLNREPRPCHKVNAFKSQTHPNMIETDSFQCSAGNQWLKVLRLHFEDVSAIEGNTRWI